MFQFISISLGAGIARLAEIHTSFERVLSPARDKRFIWKKKKKNQRNVCCLAAPSVHGGFTGISLECRDMSWLSSTSDSPTGT